jgi:endonuclease/exonuclease/phosphatase family metal-dependent hydrolase
MTYNIRYANEQPGEEWSKRKDNVAELVRFSKPDIFGLQEVLINQIEFFESNFSNYSRVGVGRDDGKEDGEHSPIFFSKRFLLIESETFWLSETPQVPSKSWDAALNRIVTTAVLFDTITNDTLLVYNTHFDHVGIIAREKSAELIINRMNSLPNNYAKILMGDFNVIDTANSYCIINNSTLKDAIEISKFKNYGTAFTFNGFNHELNVGNKIDHIFVNEKIEVLHHAVIGDRFDGKYPSDHMPVLIVFIPKNKE